MKTILLLEDDAAIRALLRTVLESRGYTVREAADATHLWDHADEPVDLIIADVSAQSRTRSDAEARFKEIRAAAATLFISGYPADQLVCRGLLDPFELYFGNANFLQKPFLPRTLTDKVKAILGAASDEGVEVPATKAPAVRRAACGASAWVMHFDAILGG